MAAVLITLIVIFFSGCGTSQEKGQVELIVSAAASLTDVLEEIKILFEEENSHITLIMNMGASGALRRQIEQGAPAHIFISASVEHMDALEEKDLIIEGTRIDLFENSLVLVVPAEESRIEEFSSLLREDIKRVALGEPESTPVGHYSREALTSIGFWGKLEPKFIYGKDVRQVLTWVETKNVDAGIVYLTDAKGNENVRVAAVPPIGSYTPVVYPAALIKDSRKAGEAGLFLNFLTGSESQAVFERYGFKIISRP